MTGADAITGTEAVAAPDARTSERVLTWMKRVAWVLVVYLVACGVAAWWLPAGPTTAKMTGLFLGLIPDRSLPLTIDPDVLVTQQPVFVKAPQTDVCPFLKIRYDADAKERAVTIVPAREPQRRDAKGALPAEADQPGCSWNVTVGDQDRSLAKGEPLRLVLGPSGGKALFETKPFASVQGLSGEVTGAFDLVPPDSGPARFIEIASRRIDLQLVLPKEGERPELTVDMDSDHPDRLRAGNGNRGDGDDRRVGWFLRRWLRFIVTAKPIVELIHKAIPSG